MVDFVDVITKEYSGEDKQRFIELIKVMIDLSNKVHDQGLLSLEEKYPSLNPFLFRKGIELIVEGCYARELRNILDNYIQAKKCSEADLLEKLIIREGVVLIQNGDNGKMLLEKILSMLGEDFFGDFDYNIFKNPLFEYQPEDFKRIDAQCENFEDKIMSIDDFNDMEKLVRRAGYFYMGLALKGASDKLNRHVRNKLSLRKMKDELNQEIRFIGSCRIEDLMDAQQFVLTLI